MTYLQHTSDRCPIDPAAPVFFILADGRKRFDDRAGNLYWGDEIPEARIISYEPAEKHPAIRLADSTAEAARHVMAVAWAALQSDIGRAWALFDALEASLSAAFEILTDFDAQDLHAHSADGLCALYLEARRGRWRARLRSARVLRGARYDEWGGWEA
jgi:hypothetical protein